MTNQNLMLKSQLAQFEFLFEQAHCGLAIVTPETNELSYVSPVFAEMHGYDRIEMIGRNLSFCLDAASQPIFLSVIKKNNNLDQKIYEMTHIRKDESQFKVESNILSIKNPEGTVLYHAVTCVDFASGEEFKRKQAKDIKSANRLREESEKSKEILNSVFDRVNDGIVALDNEWVYEYLNQRAANMLQKESPSDLIGKNIWEVYPEGVGQPFYLAYYKAAETQKSIVFEQYYQPWDEWYENRVYPSKNGITIYFTDITIRKKNEQKLKESAVLFDNTVDAVVITDLERKISKVNPAFVSLTGYEQEEVLGKKIDLLVSKKQDYKIYQSLYQSIDDKGYWQGELLNRHKDGNTFPTKLTISSIVDYDESPASFLAVFSDITALKKNEEKLERLAHYDVLTQLPNRFLLSVRLERSISVAKRENKKIALLMLDLDHFKNVNDSFGHAAGDELLQQVADRLTHRFRESDSVCRLGGDEFTILLEDVPNEEQLNKIACETIALLSEPWQLSNKFEVRIGTSIGISIYPQHGISADALLQHADTALYQAKNEGRDRYAMYNQSLTRVVKDQIVLESKLRNAIINNELRVFYQPQIDIASNKIIGAEALVRWQPPSEELIFPDSFIPVAEATGLITDLGNWVLKETCQQGKNWLDAGLPAISLAVNLSSHQFLHGDIIQTITNTLQDTQFPSEQLEIELTESALMEREGEAINKFNLLHQLGLKIAIDDFGTGYSSLSYLKKFPIDVLKIDKSFVDDIPSSKDDMVIATTIIAMAHTLGLKVLAEGVENKAQLEFLTLHHCDSYQGYIFSPAISAIEFESLLRKQSA